MIDRFTHRESYMQGWYELDDKKLVAHVTDDFIFDDPAEPEPVTRLMLPAYMLRWNQRMAVLGANNKWQLNDEVRQDKDGILTDWEWWEVVNTNEKGMALVKTSDAGVFLERITYFKRN